MESLSSLTLRKCRFPFQFRMTHSQPLLHCSFFFLVSSHRPLVSSVVFPFKAYPHTPFPSWKQLQQLTMYSIFANAFSSPSPPHSVRISLFTFLFRNAYIHKHFLLARSLLAPLPLHSFDVILILLHWHSMSMSRLYFLA